MNKIPYTKPHISELEVSFVNDAVQNGWGENCYDYLHRFERDFASYLDVKHCIATSSCTGALTLGIKALGITRGDEVILADTNWIATAAPLSQAGAIPVFVDVNADTWCINPSAVEKVISKKTKAVIATHLYGNICEMTQLRELCDRNGLALIEDVLRHWWRIWLEKSRLHR